jgi:hypothetical protein
MSWHSKATLKRVTNLAQVLRGELHLLPLPILRRRPDTVSVRKPAAERRNRTQRITTMVKVQPETVAARRVAVPRRKPVVARRVAALRRKPVLARRVAIPRLKPVLARRVAVLRRKPFLARRVAVLRRKPVLARKVAVPRRKPVLARRAAAQRKNATKRMLTNPMTTATTSLQPGAAVARRVVAQNNNELRMITHSKTISC